MADLNLSRYSAEAMVAAAHDEGLNASPRQLRDWVQRGLLDKPKKVGLGQGHGSQATWSENQLQLWLTLLRQRSRGANLTQLYSVPVWLWLRVGDDHVPVRQVRRALTRWGYDIIHQPFGPSERSAAAVTRKLAAPEAKRKVRKRLRGILADIISGGEAGVDDQLASAARDVIDPRRTRQPRGPEGAQLSPEGYVDLVHARLAAIGPVKDIDDDAFVRARAFYWFARADYAVEQPSLSKDPDLGWLFEAPTFEREMNSACKDVITILGLQRTNTPD